MTTIIHVFCWDYDRRSAAVLLSDGTNHWAAVMSLDDLWDYVSHEPGETRRQFEDDIIGRAITVIQDGEHRCTSASL